MAPPILTLKDITLTWGGDPLFSGVSLTIDEGDRACLVGRNGCGKSTLLKIIAGIIEADSGERTTQTGLKVAYLPQDPPMVPGKAVADFVAEGLNGPDETHRVDYMLHALKLDGTRDLGTLSGGEGRRAAIAQALVSQPDLLLLDEPTNHLDLPTILWLEDELARFPGAIVAISHDRAFLNKLTRSTLWLDRGTVRQRAEGFTSFEAWTNEVMEAEESEINRLNVKLKEETRWLHRGVTARRKRNMGRLRALYDLREKRAAMLANKDGSVKMTLDKGEKSGKRVIEAENISKSYDGKPIITDFSTRIIRGDRIGLLGPNGAGKTTLLKMLVGNLAPDSGEVTLGTNLEIAFFDQRRETLRDTDTLWEALCETGGDHVTVGGRPRHVVSYLKDFLFDDRQVRAPVSTLSGGERNRLLLAKLLTKPSNLLVLDEPTNDLDMDTLDLLQELLGDYEGTLLVVSHDRDFLDRLVTSVIAVEGDGVAEEYVGGYSDYLRKIKQDGQVLTPEPTKEKPAPKPKEERAKKQTKLSYKDQRELDGLPEKIAKLEEEISDLEKTLHDPDLFTKNPDRFQKATDRLAAAQAELEQAEERWLELEALKEELAG